MVNNKPKNINLNKSSMVDDFVRINTLYNKDDNDDLLTTKREDATKILMTESNESKYINNKTELGHNTLVNKIINGLNENSTITSNNENIVHNKNKSIEKNFVVNNNLSIGLLYLYISFRRKFIFIR